MKLEEFLLKTFLLICFTFLSIGNPVFAKNYEVFSIQPVDSILIYRSNEFLASADFLNKKQPITSEMKGYSVEEIEETPLVLEDWMLEEKNFEPVYLPEKEPKLDVEKWMTDENCWKFSR